MSKIVLISNSGLLGGAIHKNFILNGINCKSSSRKDPNSEQYLDLENPSSRWNSFLKGSELGIITSAMTDVEQCFRCPEKSKRVNVDGTQFLLEKFREFKIKPIFFSSDLVFDGGVGNFKETDKTNPTTIYGSQKLLIENFIATQFKEFVIFRTSKLMSMGLHPRSILTPIVRALLDKNPINLFCDQIISPVFVEDIATICLPKNLRSLNGIYHLGLPRSYSRLEIGEFVAKILGVEANRLKSISMDGISRSEPRGKSNTVCSDKIRSELNCEFTTLEAGIKNLILELGNPTSK